GAHDRAIDVRLGGKVDDGLRPGRTAVPRQQGPHQCEIPDVAAHESVPAVPVPPEALLDVLEALHIARVGEQVEVHHVDVVLVLQHPADEVGSDEAGAAGDEQTGGGEGGHRTGPPYSGRSGRSSESGGYARSFSDNSGCCSGQSIAIAESFHTMPCSSSGA